MRDTLISRRGNAAFREAPTRGTSNPISMAQGKIHKNAAEQRDALSGEGAPTGRTILAGLLLVMAETAWALFCAAVGVNLALFYAVLVASSAVFWVPGVVEPRGAR